MGLIFIVVIVLLVLFIGKLYFNFKESAYIKSDHDDNHYLIRNASEKSEDYLKGSANTLAEINSRVERLISHLEQHDNYKNVFFVKKLRQGYKPSIISEAAVDERFTTFTVNKQEMHICLRTRDEHKKLYDINLLMYVVIHELAHLCNYDDFGIPIHGHGREFKNIFKILTEESINIGVYTYTDYTKKPQEYCGIMINSSIISH